MRLNSRKLFTSLLVCAVALLPLRLGHAVPPGDPEAGPSISHHDSHDCHSSGSPQSSHHCAEHGSDGVSISDCCGDQCVGAQGLVTGAFEFQFPGEHNLSALWLQPSPVAIAFHWFRPPISIS